MRWTFYNFFFLFFCNFFFNLFFFYRTSGCSSRSSSGTAYVVEEFLKNIFKFFIRGNFMLYLLR
ncbi:unnamed protein product [Meloidogyne enterolobii]|uniref:Uncharacterized protein n=1 Tax=Meloidogyne enterolobii TaxID=390850 RepID=A0ACB0XSD0_MELEN